MNTSPEAPPRGRITGYRFGSITVDGRTYRRDVIIFPDAVLSPWWRREGHFLQLEDLQEVIARKPPLLIVGTGASGVMKIHESLPGKLAHLGIAVTTQTTDRAVHTYNRAYAAGGEAVAALHLTC